MASDDGEATGATPDIPGSPALEADALAWILDLPDSAEFVSERLGRTWFHARSGRRDRFAGLLSLGQLDEILGAYGLRHANIRLARLDEDIPAREYLWRDQMVDPQQVARFFSEGATVIFGALHDRHEGLRRLCAAVTEQVSARSQTNIYLTPPNAQGFKPHWDTHDVYVLQVEGSKRWRIYAGGPELPLKDQKFDPGVHQPGEVEAELTLEAGEALYVPRGIMHAATSTDALSMHVTLGVMAYTWADLLVDVLAEVVERSPDWRANVSFGFARDPEGRRNLGARLEALIADLAGEMDLAAVVQARRQDLETVLRPRVTDLLRQARAAASVAEDDRIRWRPGVAGRLERRNGRVVVVSGPREIEFPDAAARTLERLLRGDALSGKQLDDSLDWESRKVVVSALIREGLVRNESAANQKPV